MVKFYFHELTTENESFRAAVPMGDKMLYTLRVSSSTATKCGQKLSEVMTSGVCDIKPFFGPKIEPPALIGKSPTVE